MKSIRLYPFPARQEIAGSEALQSSHIAIGSSRLNMALRLETCQASSGGERWPQRSNTLGAVEASASTNYTLSECSECSECLECSECEECEECEECSSCEECERIQEECVGAPGTSGRTDHELHSYCDICGIDDSEFDLLGQSGTFWSKEPVSLQEVVDGPFAPSGEPHMHDRADSPSSQSMLPSSEEATDTDHGRLVCTDPLRHRLKSTRDNSFDPTPTLLPSSVNLCQTIPSLPSPDPPAGDLSCSLLQRSVGRCQWDDPVEGICGVTFATPRDLHNHLKKVHNIGSEVFCRWDSCYCGHRTGSPHYFPHGLLRHSWGHSGYRPYKCPACPAEFAAAHVRDEHIANIHFGQKRYSCDVCGCNHKCSSLPNLKRHKQDKHRDERFECEYCNRAGKRRLFSRAENLVRHFRTCKAVLMEFPKAPRDSSGVIKKGWFPPGYGQGRGGTKTAQIIALDSWKL